MYNKEKIDRLNKEIELLEIQKVLYENLGSNYIKDIESELKYLKDEKEQILNNQREENIDVFLNNIFNEDCFNIIPKIPKDSVHLFLSDIPYGINLDEWDVLHNNTNSALLGSSPAQQGKSGFKRRGKPINGWNEDDKKINDEYEAWVRSWGELVFPIMKEGGSIFIFGARRTISAAVRGLEKSGFLMRDMLAWRKEQAHDRRQDILNVILGRGTCYKITEKILSLTESNLELYPILDSFKRLEGKEFYKYTHLLKELELLTNNKKLISKYKLFILENTVQDDEIIELTNQWRGWKIGNLAPIYEPIAWLFKPYSSVTLTDNIIKNGVGAMNIQECLIDGKSPTNILEFGFTNDEKKNKIHEAQKPIELIEYLIRLTTIENQVVLDPFMGSGTTAVAASRLNRKYIGCERDGQYYIASKQRINHEIEKFNEVNKEEVMSTKKKK